MTTQLGTWIVIGTMRVAGTRDGQAESKGLGEGVSGFHSARGKPLHERYHKNVSADLRLESRDLWREKRQAQGETNSKGRDRGENVNLRVIAVI